MTERTAQNLCMVAAIIGLPAMLLLCGHAHDMGWTGVGVAALASAGWFLLIAVSGFADADWREGERDG